jgi:tetratricopeptide (TPR) repeat protein
MRTQFWRETGDHAGSLRALDTGVRELRGLKPVPVVCVARFGVAYAWAGRVTEAQKLLSLAESAADEKVPEQFHAVNLLRGEIELASGNPQHAIETFHLAAQAFPAYACLTNESLGRAHLAAGQPELAIADFDNVLGSHTCQGWEAQQGWVLAHLHIAQAYGALNQPQKATNPLTSCWPCGKRPTQPCRP